MLISHHYYFLVQLSACSVGWFVSLLVREEVLLADLCERKILFRLKIYDHLRQATSKRAVYVHGHGLRSTKPNGFVPVAILSTVSKKESAAGGSGQPHERRRPGAVRSCHTVMKEKLLD